MHRKLEYQKRHWKDTYQTVNGSFLSNYLRRIVEERFGEVSLIHLYTFVLMGLFTFLEFLFYYCFPPFVYSCVFFLDKFIYIEVQKS